MKPMEKMCDNCPFGTSKKQLHMCRSLRRGRFDEICQSVFQGFVFACHKTTSHDEEDEWTPTSADRECAGSIRFRHIAISNRKARERSTDVRK
jgi:hypothetical protein